MSEELESSQEVVDNNEGKILFEDERVINITDIETGKKKKEEEKRHIAVKTAMVEDVDGIHRVS